MRLNKYFLLTAAVISAASIVYELLIASAMSFLLGDTILYFSLVIGLFLVSMGIGSYFSQKLGKSPSEEDSEETNTKIFLNVELFLAVIGGFSVLILLFTGALAVNFASQTAELQMAAEQGQIIKIIFSTTIPLHLIGLILILSIGGLIGVELPILFRLLKTSDHFRSGLSNMLAFDYLGSFFGSLLFPLVFLPTLGILKTSFLMGALNVSVCALIVWVGALRKPLKAAYGLAVAVLLFLFIISFAQSDNYENYLDTLFYSFDSPTEIISKIQSPYQTIVLTEREENGHPELALFLNGYLQFDSAGESRVYHETLIHPAMHLAADRSKVLILGGGDGLPAKEVLRYLEVERVVNVDIDKEIIEFSKNNSRMRDYNGDAFQDERLEVIINDAFIYVREAREKFDAIFVDFPEGIDVPLARSYSKQFILDLKRLLNDGGILVFQVDTYDTLSYWVVVKTIQGAGLAVLPMYTGELSENSYEAEGIILASNKPFVFSRLDGIDDFWVKPIFTNKDLDFSSKIADLRVNTFYQPTFLNYFRREFWYGFWIGS